MFCKSTNLKKGLLDWKDEYSSRGLYKALDIKSSYVLLEQWKQNTALNSIRISTALSRVTMNKSIFLAVTLMLVFCTCLAQARGQDCSGDLTFQNGVSACEIFCDGSHPDFCILSLINACRCPKGYTRMNADSFDCLSSCPWW